MFTQKLAAPMPIFGSVVGQLAVLFALLIAIQVGFTFWISACFTLLNTHARQLETRLNLEQGINKLAIDRHLCVSAWQALDRKEPGASESFAQACLSWEQDMDNLLDTAPLITPEYKTVAALVISDRDRLEDIRQKVEQKAEPAAGDLDNINDIEIHKQIQKLRRLPGQPRSDYLWNGNWLAIASCINVLIMLVLLGVGFLLLHNLLRRTRGLMNNQLKLARGLPVGPRIPGTDEIAWLDNAFHEMAADIALSRQKERAIVQYADDVICSIDTESRFLEINPAITRLSGYQPEALVGQYYWEILFPGDRANVHERFQQLVNSGPGKLDLPIKTSDGGTRYSQWSVSWAPEERRWFCVIHDTTERKRVEELRQQFVSMVSHDLRTPLTSIKFFLTGIQNDSYSLEPTALKQHASIAAASADRLIAMVNDLLDIDKFEAGQLELNKQFVSLFSIASAAVASTTSLLETGDLRVEQKAPKTLLYADADRLTQVLINLLGNAIKFSNAGDTIVIDGDEQEEYIEVRVADQGPGIDESQQSIIFDRFKQVKDQNKNEGTGLGLSICKAIIEAHGGTIGVRSSPGAGSTFWFRLPLLSE